MTSELTTVLRGIIIGAGAQGRISAAVWRAAQPTVELLFLDDDETLCGTRVCGVPVLGPTSAIGDFCRDAAVAIIALGNNYVRSTVAQRLEAKGIQFANIVDPSAVLVSGSRLGTGIFVGPQAVVQTGARIGDHVIVNTGAIIEHDCVVERGATIASGARVGGRVHVEQHAFVATGATLVGRIRVGTGAIIGAGSVVTRDVLPGCLTHGCPARFVRQATQRDWERLY